MINAIMACTPDWGIGYQGKLPWPTFESDMSYFKKLTKGKTVLMGRKTWDSLPESVRPLPGRKNIVISSSPEDHMHGMDLEAAKEYLSETNDEVFIIGGAQVYKELEEFVGIWYVTTINKRYASDTKFTPDLTNFNRYGEITVNDSGVAIKFTQYNRKK